MLGLVSKKDKTALKQLFVTIRYEITRRKLEKYYGRNQVNVQVEIVEIVRSEKHQWLGKLARLWDVKRVHYENDIHKAFQRNDVDNIAVLLDGTLLTARTPYRPYTHVDFDSISKQEYRRLFEYGEDWLKTMRLGVSTLRHNAE